MLVLKPQRGGFAAIESRFRVRLSKAVQRAVETGADHAVRIAGTEFKHQRRTGKVTSRESIKWRPVKRDMKGLTIDFLNITKYSKFLEDGTKAHGPVKAKALKITLPSGAVIFRTWVKGIEPMPFMYPAALKAGDKIAEHFERVEAPRLAREFS